MTSEAPPASAVVPRHDGRDALFLLPWMVAASVVGLFAPLLVPLATGKVFTQGDLMVFHLPLRYLYRKALIAGDSIIWTPALFAGFYVHGEGQVGAAHPLHLFLYRNLALDHAFNLELISTYVVGFSGMYLLCRRFVLSPAASGLGAMLFAFSGFNLLHANHLNAVAVVSHIPWLLLAAELLLNGESAVKRVAGYAGVACGTASQLLLGYPQYVWITFIAIVPFAWYRGRSAFRRMPWLIAALGIGTVMGAIQWWPTADAIAHSVRTSYPRTFYLAFSLHPLNLVQFWLPYAYAGRVYADPAENILHELGVYDGAFALAALAWLLVRRGRLRGRSTVVALAIFTVFALVLALGKYAGLPWLMTKLPVVGQFRAPARYIALVHLGIAALGAIAFDDLIDFSARQRGLVGWTGLWPLAVPPMLGSATAVLLLGGDFTRIAPYLHVGDPSVVILGAVLSLAASALVVLVARGHTYALFVIPVLVAIDLGAWGYSYMWAVPPMPVRQLAAAADVPATAIPGQRIFAPVPPTTSNFALLRGFQLTAGYVALWPMTNLADEDIVKVRLSGARWRWTPSGWAVVDHAIPRARMMSDVRRSNQFAADLHDIDLMRTALVDETPPHVEDGRSEVTVISDVPGRLELAVVTESPQLLALTERYHEGWRATGDGRPLNVVRVDGEYLGCVVERGTRRVTFEFAPISMRGGAMLTAAGAVALVLSCLILRRAA